MEKFDSGELGDNGDFFNWYAAKRRLDVWNKIKYKYQWQSSEGELLKRWDNDPHHRELNTFQDHVHDPNGVYPSSAMNLKSILYKGFNLENASHTSFFASYIYYPQ
ncbi:MULTISPECIES: DUF6516 family protein [unclassified Methanosarcina]|uniref:toxin-antitoxin system TumE family protein n=1 Tax=unclassified Methanosarcina TaxID=2644672 RepID=UPI0012E0646E|nr:MULTISPECIES: DUF6516 family protein [unclassified Methanosarcina]